MARVSPLPPDADLTRLPLLIDGPHAIPLPQWVLSGKSGPVRLEIPKQITVIKGDSLVPGISAASILAKTFRDKLMKTLDRRWPGYGLAKHKGYGTAEHVACMESAGLCPLHRRSFKLKSEAADQYSLF